MCPNPYLILNDSTTHWYAAKIYADKTNILKYLASKHIETFIPMQDGKPLLGPVLFLYCTEDTIIKAKIDWFRQMMLYRDAERERPQMIPDSEMDNFKMVLCLKNQEMYPLEVYDREFMKGQKVRVLDGPLKGAVGIIKRVKGDRRLIVSVSGIAAVATSHVHPGFLEPAE